MTATPLDLGPLEGVEALHGHLIEKALEARAAYPPPLDRQTLEHVLLDPRIVRYPVALHVDAAPLQPGELAWLARPEDGYPDYRLYLDPRVVDLPEALTAVSVYQLVVVNYGRVAGAEEAEIYGAAWLGMEREAYYGRLCELHPGP